MASVPILWNLDWAKEHMCAVARLVKQHGGIPTEIEVRVALLVADLEQLQAMATAISQFDLDSVTLQGGTDSNGVVS